MRSTVKKMRLKAVVTIVVAWLFMVVAAWPESPRIQWTQCGPRIDKRAQCGRMDVPLDYQQPNKEKLSLNLAVLRSESGAADAEPIVFFLGGPGQAATDLALGAGPWLQTLRAKHDILLVDQRGTGGSRGLFCAPADEASRRLQSYLGELFPADEIRRCYARHQVRSELFTTEVAMRDLDLVREALGVARLNLYGASYGTRAALSYLRQFPQRVRTVILKSPAPMNLVLAQNFAPDAQASFDRILQLCAGDERCHADFPKFREEFDAVRERLSHAAATASLNNPKTGRQEPVTIDLGLFVTTVRSALYSPRRFASLPFMIHRAYAGDWQPFAQQAFAIRYDIEGDAAGLYLAIVCSEDYPFLQRPKAESAAKGTFLGTYWLDQIRQGCENWPARPVEEKYRQDVRATAPVLLITGALDPVTPPKYAREAARWLPNGLVVTFPYGSHSFNGGDCETSLAAAVIARGTTKNLNTTCVAQQPAVKFAAP